uniref:Gag-like protein n=1 Tax=Tricholoma matsutake TaxID=40145 RepID=Q9C4A6_TRIMT|nr:Gag-like protein [Tricholoma matsutake]
MHAGNLSVATDVVASDEDLRCFKEAAHKAFPYALQIDAALPTSMSYLKLVDVPYIANDKAITPDVVIAHLGKSGISDLTVLQVPPRVVRDSRMSDTCTVYLNVADSVSSARAKALIGRGVQFRRYVAYVRAARANPGLPLCQRCWKWGHPTPACRAPQSKCPICAGPHRKEHHRALAGCCKGNAKANPPIPATPEGAACPHPARCTNCRKNHASDDRRCNFWRHRFDRDWIKARYDEVSARRNSRSPPTYHPAGRGGRT